MMKFKILCCCILIGNFALAQEWQADFENALTLAQNREKQLLLVFAGSDWCAPCIKLDKEIWQSTEFKEYAKGHYVLYKADFPRKKANKLSDKMTEQNAILAEKYNRQGHFPLIVLLDKDSNVLGETGYRKLSPSDFISQLNSFEK